MLIIGLLALIATCHSQSDSDWSFKARCTFLHGDYFKRSGYNDTNPVGERCKATFPYSTGNDQLARKFCEETMPFHIIEATAKGPRTICLAEAGLICKTNWIQLYGRCYFMERKLMKYKEAKDYCKKLDSGIAFMHRDILPVHWNNYYTKVGKVWVDGSSVYRDSLIYNKGNDMMLAFEGYGYGMKSLSLIRVNGSIDKAFPLCEYTPLMTRAESLYLLRRYSEIYYTGLTTSQGMFIRTASFRNADDVKRKAGDNEYCANAMKPFLRGAKVDLLRASEDELEFLIALKASKSHQFPFYRSTEFLHMSNGKSHPQSYRDKPQCQSNGFDVMDNRKFRVNMSTCDGGTYSTAVKLVGSGEMVLDRCSDALWGPMYCEAKLAIRDYKPCPSGYKEYLRSSGAKWCHKYVADELSAEDAEKKCQQDGAHLSGAESMDELKFLAGLNSKSSSWLGAQRRQECRWGGGEQKGWREEGECSRNLVFQWTNYAAQNPPFFDDNTWDNVIEPNYLHNGENCLELKQANGRVTINDLSCESNITFLCGKEADVQE